MSSFHEVNATVVLESAKAIQREFPLPSGSRSVVFFPYNKDGSLSESGYGAVLNSEDGTDLQFDEREIRASLTLWDDGAADVFKPGVVFQMWLGRPIGRGVVAETVDD